MKSIVIALLAFSLAIPALAQNKGGRAGGDATGAREAGKAVGTNTDTATESRTGRPTTANKGGTAAGLAALASVSAGEVLSNIAKADANAANELRRIAESLTVDGASLAIDDSKAFGPQLEAVVKELASKSRLDELKGVFSADIVDQFKKNNLQNALNQIESNCKNG